MPCLGEHLEAYARGELQAAEAEAVFAHLRTCEHCTREVAWLRAERRILADRASSRDPHPLHAAALRRSLEQRLAASAPQRRWQAWKLRAPIAGRVMLSAFAAVLLAFVAASIPQGATEVSLGTASGSSCVSMEVAGFCPAPSEPQELMAAVEDQFDACLVATPRSSGAPELCW